MGFEQQKKARAAFAIRYGLIFAPVFIVGGFIFGHTLRVLLAFLLAWAVCGAVLGVKWDLDSEDDGTTAPGWYWRRRDRRATSITFFFFVIAGIFSFVPYYIFNFVKIFLKPRLENPQLPEKAEPDEPAGGEPGFTKDQDGFEIPSFLVPDPPNEQDHPPWEQGSEKMPWE